MPISVKTIHRTGRRFIECQWIDPVTQLKKTRSTGTADRRKADRFAAKLEEQLNGEGLQEPSRTTWLQLWTRYKADVLDGQAKKTRNKNTTAHNSLMRVIKPHFAAAITTEVLVRFATTLRGEELSTFTIKGYLSEIRKVLRWGDRLGLINRAPTVEMPRTIGGMKGRPITLEEFERMQDKVEGEVGAAGKESWAFLLQGLWLSGLRIEEAAILHWTDDEQIAVDLSGKFPMMRIQAQYQKSRRYELLPLTPDFGNFLLAVPPAQRRGYVFNPRPLSHQTVERLSAEWMAKIVTRIGEAALVKVNATKFASCHDLRRAFGARWSVHVMPAVLQALMRHKSIQTTMQFYVGKNADAIAEQVWKAAAGNTFGNTTPQPQPPDATVSTQEA